MKKISEHDLFDAIGNIDHKYIKNAENSEDRAHEVPIEVISTQSRDEAPFVLSTSPDDPDAPMIVPSHVAKPVMNRIIPLLAAAAIVLAFIAGAYAYRLFHKANDPKDPDKNDIANAATEAPTAIEVAISDTTAAPANTTPTEAIVAPTEAAVGTEKLTLPGEDVNKIVIQRGDLGEANYDSLTFEDTKTLQDIIAKLGEISGEKIKYTALLEKNAGSGQYSFSLNCCKNYSSRVVYYFLSDNTILERSGTRYRAIKVDTSISVLPYITSKLNNPEFVPDSPYDWANTQYLILEVGDRAEGWFTSSELRSKYVEVTCKVLYGNKKDIDISVSKEGYTWHVPVSNIQSLYIPEEMADEITSHDMILIRRASLSDRHSMDFSHLQGEFSFMGYDENDTPEFLTFKGGKLNFPESNSSECLQSFASLYALNEEVDRSMGQDPKPGDIPRQKITDGMTLQEVIDYFDAFQAWVASLDQP